MNFEELYVDTCTSTSLAAARGDAENLNKLIKNKKPINGQDNKGWRALHHACFGGHIDCIKILLSAPDVEIDAPTFERQTPLYLTCCSDLEVELKVKVAEVLLEAGANPNYENQNQYITILNQAISSCNLSLVKLLLNHGVNVNEFDDKNGSSLNAAVETENLDIIKLITSQGLEFTTYPGGPPTIAFFHTSVLQRNVFTLKHLVQKPRTLKEINYQDIRGRTCLYLACSVGFREGIKILLDAGGDPNIRCLENDLPVMAFTEHVEDEDLTSPESLLGQLIRLTNKVELKKPTSCDTSFFHMLAHCDKQYEIFEYVLKTFPDLYSSTIVAKLDNTLKLQSTNFKALFGSFNLSPLAYWCGLISENKNYEFFHRMVKIDYHLRDTSRSRLPPLLMACGTEKVDPYVICYLLQNGADVMSTIGQVIVKNLPTSFHMALFSPTTCAIKTLLINTVPADILFRGMNSQELSNAVCGTEVWLITRSVQGSVPCINLLNNLICLFDFTPSWTFDLSILKHKLNPPRDLRHKVQELFKKCDEITENPKNLWHLACLQLRRTIWETGGGVLQVPMCVSIEKYCAQFNLPPKIKQILLFEEILLE